MFIAAHRLLSFDAGLEREVMDQVADAIAPLFDSEVPGERIGLIVASDNAGSATSVRFWAEAVRTGVGLASPERFPWCLANAPCGALARRFAITGPNSTLLGEADALLAALETSVDLFAQGSIDSAIIVALSFASDSQCGRAIALRMLHDGTAHAGPTSLAALHQSCSSLSLRSAIDLLGLHLNAC